jgi:hypothetical protein
MATPCVLSKDARNFIIANATLTNEELRKSIFEKYHVDVSDSTIQYHLQKARNMAELATQAADMHLSQTLSERVAAYAPTILARYEKEMERIASVLDGTNSEFVLEIGNDGTRDKYWAEKYTKLYNELSKSYLALRPQISTVKIESKNDPDVAAIASMTDEELSALKALQEAHKKAQGE